MNRTILLIAMAVWSLAAVRTASVRPHNSLRRAAGEASAAHAARLLVSVENIKYCKGDDYVYTAHLRLRLRYTNLGAQNMILFKAVKPIDIVSGVIGTGVGALADKRYESTIQYDQFVELPGIRESARPDPSQFAIVAPGNSYELDGELAVPVRFTDERSQPGTIAAGTHAMTVEVADWPFASDAGDRLQKRWSKLGLLNYEVIVSEPFEFSVSRTPRLVTCF